MPPEKTDAAYLYDMLRYSRVVVDMIRDATYASFCGDLKLRFAIERGIYIVGEAARKVSDEFESAHPEVPWQKIVGQRHVLAHEYGEIDTEKIWRVATVYIPELILLLEPLVPPAPPDPDPEP